MTHEELLADSGERTDWQRPVRQMLAVISVVGAAWIAYAETSLSMGPQEFDFAGYARRWVTAAAVAYLVTLPASLAWSRRRSPRGTLVSEAASAAMLTALAAIVCWTWQRGAQSRLLLAGGSEVLAVVTSVLLLEIAWTGLGWWRSGMHADSMGRLGEPSRLLMLLDGLHRLAGVALAAAWIGMELAELPHGP